MYALYARQSVEKKDSISVESQLDFCRYETRGEPYETYVDKGFSGKDLHRPAFEKMLEQIRAGRIQKVVVYKLDRISRSILDFSNMMELFRTYGVEFISSTEKFDTSAPIGRAMLNICIVFAQLERETIQRRVADAYAARSKKGFYMGGRVPYGFRREPVIIQGVRTSRFVPVEEECRQIRLMYALYADPVNSLGDVVGSLQAHGGHLRGGIWSTPRVSELLRNPVYVRADAGVYEFYKSRGTQIVNPVSDFTGENGCYLFRGESARKSDLAGQELVLAPHEGIIPAAQWLRCRQRCMENRRSAETSKAKNSWLSGKTKCGRCGYALTVVKSNSKWGRYFVCSHTAKGGCPGTGGTIYAEVLERYIQDAIGERLARMGPLYAVEETDPEENSLRLRLSSLEEEISELLDRVPDANETLMRYLGERVEALDRKRSRLQAQLEAPAAAGEAIVEPAAWWLNAPFALRQAVLDAMVEVIRIAGRQIEIVWKVSESL